MKIDKNVPIPKYAGGSKARGEISLTALALKVGDSFFVADKLPAQIYGYLKVARDKGIKVTTREENGGVRIWRIK